MNWEKKKKKSIWVHIYWLDLNVAEFSKGFGLYMVLFTEQGDAKLQNNKCSEMKYWPN